MKKDSFTNHSTDISYFKERYESCHASFIASYGEDPALLDGKVTGITDKNGYDRRAVIRAKLQYDLSLLLKSINAPATEEGDIAALKRALASAQATYTRDGQLDSVKDFFYPIDKIIFGLCLVLLFSFNIFFSPLSALIFSIMFLVSNSYQNGLYSKLNIGFGLSAVALAVLTVLGVLSAAGVAVIASPYILGVMALAFTTMLCLTAIVRGSLRSIEAAGNVEKSLNMNIDLCAELAKKIAVESDPELKEEYEDKLELALESYKMLLSEQENLVRTIKNPFDKYFTHIRNTQNRISKIYTIKGLDEGTREKLLAFTATNKNSMMRVLQGDIPWLIINIAMIAIAASAAIGLLPLTVNLMIVVISLACLSGFIDFALRMYNNRPDVVSQPANINSIYSKSSKQIVVVLDLIGGFALHVLVNILLVLSLVVVSLAKVLTALHIPLIGKEMGSVLGLSSWLLGSCRSLVYSVLIPADKDSAKYTREYDRDEGEITKLIFALGEKAAADNSKKSLFASDEGCCSYKLPHFAVSDCTARMLSEKYLEELAKYVEKNPSAKKIMLIGKGAEGAILASVLEKVLVDERFKHIEAFNLCLDDSFTSVGAVTRGTGVLGFLYPAGPLLSLLGWNLNPASSIENILASHNLRRDTEIKIYITSSNSSATFLGKAALKAKSCFSRGNIEVYAKEKNSSNGFVEQNYFADRLERAKRTFGEGDLQTSKDIKITDSKAFASMPVYRAQLQSLLASTWNAIKQLDKITDKDDKAQREERIAENIKKIGEVSEEAKNTYRRDNKLEDAKDVFYPVAKITLGLGLVLLASVNIIFVPAFALIFSLMFLLSNTYKEGLYSRLNIAFMFTSVSFFALALLGSLAVAGVTLAVAPYVLPLTAAVSAIFFGVVLARSIMRSNDAKNSVEQGLIMNLACCSYLAKKIDDLDEAAKGMKVDSPEYLKNRQEKTNHATLFGEAMNSFKMLSSEQENLIRAVKSPVDKYLKQMPKVAKRRKSIESSKGSTRSMMNLLDLEMRKASHKANKVFIRDIPWTVANAVILVVSIAVAVAVLPATIGLMAFVLAVAVVATVLSVGIRLSQKSSDEATAENKNEVAREDKGAEKISLNQTSAISAGALLSRGSNINRLNMASECRSLERDPEDISKGESKHGMHKG